MVIYFLLSIICAAIIIEIDNIAYVQVDAISLLNSAGFIGLLAAIFLFYMRDSRKKPVSHKKKFTWTPMALVCATVMLHIASVWLDLPEAINREIRLDNWMKPSVVAFGVYDPNKDFHQENVLIEHQFIPWRLDNTTEFTAAVEYARQINRFPMVTLEPWSWNWNGMTNETLLQDIVSGKYDATLKMIFIAAQQQSPTLILMRWGHEMEMVGQYPWAKKNANAYVAAYRYVVEFSRKMGVNNLMWVWSPAGNKEAMYYWPGEEYVDYIGVSIYADTVAEKASGYWGTRSFEKLMTEKYWFAKSYGKPMIVAEVGINDTPEYKERWLKAAIKSLHKFPAVRGWVYFNQVQPRIVPYPYGVPNWELTQQQVKTLAHNWEEFNDGRLSNQNIQEFFRKT